MYLLVHISDIHSGSEPAPKPVEAVLAAVRGLGCKPALLALLLSGDMAYSGKEGEYASITKFLVRLRDGLRDELEVDCHVIACPGNHDCDFPEDVALRSLAIDAIRLSGKVPDSPEVAETCMRVQRPFFDWARSLGASLPSEVPCLAWRVDVVAEDGAQLQVRVLNTAWMSTMKETQGGIHFPVPSLPDIPRSGIRVSMLHHSLSWFEAANGRELRRALEADSDVVVTGHEHDPDSYSVSRDQGRQSVYVEGGAFGGAAGRDPSFNVVLVDPDAGTYLVKRFGWKGDAFTCENLAEDWRRYISWSAGRSREHSLSEEMRSFLSDPGMPLTHHAKTLSLQDVFVAPELRGYESDVPNGQTIPSDLCMSKLLSDKYAYVLGDNQSGKTALAKMIFVGALERQCTPVLLSGADIKMPNSGRLRELIEKAVAHQYVGLSAERYWQLEGEQRAVIVDDFGQAQLNSKGQREVAMLLKQQAGSVFLFGGDLTQVERVMAAPDGGGLTGYKRYDIRRFGYLLRDTLIERWITIGAEYKIDDEEFQHLLRQTARQIDRVLQGNLLPANPAYILMLLQRLEAEVPLDVGSGSYGQFYEVMVTLALRRSSRSPVDVDAKYTYLSELAWHMLCTERRSLDEEDLRRFTEGHVERFELSRGPDEFLKEVLDSRVLQAQYGRFGFAYRYSRYYFIARYMRDNTHDESVQACIARAVAEIHREDFANILIFYTYLTKSKPVIELVLDKARGFFSDVEPCDFDGHVAFIRRLQERVPEVVLPEVDPREERKAALRSLDESSPEGQSADDPEEGREGASDLEAGQTHALNGAAKTLQVLGQILRNFSGSLRKEQKLEMTRECIDLSLRSLNSMYGSLERKLDEVINELSELFGRDLSELPPGRRVEAARWLVFIVTEALCLVTLQRLSHDVGSEDLIRTYEALERVYDTKASRFVQLSLRLDHYRQFPETRVLKLLREVGTDSFGLTLLRMLVIQHFHQFSRSHSLQQSVCAKLGVRYTPSLPRPTKALPAPSKKKRRRR